MLHMPAVPQAELPRSFHRDEHPSHRFQEVGDGRALREGERERERGREKERERAYIQTGVRQSPRNDDPEHSCWMVCCRQLLCRKQLERVPELGDGRPARETGGGSHLVIPRLADACFRLRLSCLYVSLQAFLPFLPPACCSSGGSRGPGR